MQHKQRETTRKALYAGLLIVPQVHNRKTDWFSEDTVDQIKQLCATSSCWIANHSISEKLVTLLQVMSLETNATGVRKGRCLVSRFLLDQAFCSSILTAA